MRRTIAYTRSRYFGLPCLASAIESSQDCSRRRAIAHGAAKTQRQTDQLVPAGGNGTQVQAFNNDYSARKQRAMSLVIHSCKLFDREVVDADQVYSLLGQSLRGVQIEIGEIRMKLRI